MSIPTPRKTARPKEGLVTTSEFDLAPKPIRSGAPVKSLYHFSIPWYGYKSIVVASTRGEAEREVLRKFSRVNFGKHPIQLVKVVPVQQ